MATLTAQRESISQIPEPLPLRRAEGTSEVAAAVKKPRKRALIVLPTLALLAAGSAAVAIALGRGKESTDDAQVEGHVASVAPRVAGQVLKVLVKDNQRVHAGDLLVELDDRDYAARLAAARADLAAARAQLHATQTQLAVITKETDSNLAVARGGIAQANAADSSTRAAIAQASAELTAAEAQRSLVASDLERNRRLIAGGALSQAQYDASSTAVERAEAAVAQARARLVSAESNLGGSKGSLQSARGRLIAAQAGPEQVEAATAQVELARARVDQAQAAVDQATLNREYTHIRAEIDGVVARRTVELGQMASPERPLLALVGVDDTWVVANFKEDQLGQLAAGKRAQVSIDAFPGKKLSGHVDSVAGGTGARFSLLPPDNASGNFTKVVQRVPVLIRLDPHPGVALRPGLSAVATVYTK